MSVKKISKSIFSQRLSLLQHIIAKEHIDAYVTEDSIEILYYTGLTLSFGRLWVTKSSSALFVDSRYIQAAQQGSAVQPVYLLSKDKEKELLSHALVKVIAFDGALFSFSRVETLKKAHENDSLSFVSKEGLISSLRVIKDTSEVQMMKKSAALLKKVYRALLDEIEIGMTESALASSFEILLRQMGAERSAFDPIVAFGASSAMPHYRPGRARLKKGQMILLDLGLVLDGYHSDMTRVLFHDKPDPVMAGLCSVVRRAHSAAVALCSPGTKIGALDEAARCVMREEGLEQYFTHSLGHGIGLITHEAPRIRFDSIDKDKHLTPGMVITIEPGLYLPNKGGVRWEDMILITETGHVNLTKGV